MQDLACPAPIRIGEWADCILPAFAGLRIRRKVYSWVDLPHNWCFISSFLPLSGNSFFKNFHSEAKIIERNQKGEILVYWKKLVKVIGTGIHCRNRHIRRLRWPGVSTPRGTANLSCKHSRRKRMPMVSAKSYSAYPCHREDYESLGYKIIKNCTIDVGEGQRWTIWEGRRHW